jgi:hypothetical protein
MQCGCPECGILLTQVVKGLDSACKCPECGYTCRACLGLQKGANLTFEKGMSSEDWELILRMRKEKR